MSTEMRLGIVDSDYRIDQAARVHAVAAFVRATGDARCNTKQWSWLDSAPAECGALVRGQASTQAGASIATAALSGHVAARLMRHPGANRDARPCWLRAHAAFIGVERRMHAS